MILQLELKIDFCHVDGPSKLVSLALVVDLVHRHPHFLTPAQVETHTTDTLEFQICFFSLIAFDPEFYF